MIFFSLINMQLVALTKAVVLTKHVCNKISRVFYEMFGKFSAM